jgi:hypothetical protein
MLGDFGHPASGIDRDAFHKSGNDLDALCCAQAIHDNKTIQYCQINVKMLTMKKEYD